MKAVLLAAAAALALSGCSSEAQEPESLPPVTSAPTPSIETAPLPSPSLTGPKAEVERAVLAYFAAINHALATGDLSGYTSLHRPECQACKNLSDLVRSTAAKGQRFEGAQDVIESYEIPDFSGANAIADVRFRVTPYRIVAEDGSVVDTSEGSQRRNLIVLNLVDGAWLVGEVNAS